jgi:membrane protein
MNISYRYQRWRLSHGDDMTGKVADRLMMVVDGLVRLKHMDFAARLSFNTIMAIIPIFAIIFAVSKGFGFEEEVARVCKEFFASQPQVADAIISLAHSYIVYTHTGWFVGIALIFMLYTVIMLIRDIESVFNSIWHVKRERDFKRTIVDYVAMIFTVPFLLILFSGVSVFLSTILDHIPGFLLWEPATKFLVSLVLPLMVLWLFFMLTFMFVPNTKVQLRYVWIPALIAAMMIILLQKCYFYFQLLFTSYSIIYGSFAALPLFLLWVQISWYITLGCVELCHANQKLDIYGMAETTPSIEQHITECQRVFEFFCQRQLRGANVCDMDEMKQQTDLSYAALQRVVPHMVKARLLSRSLDAEDASKAVYTLRCKADISKQQFLNAIMKTPLK